MLGAIQYYEMCCRATKDLLKKAKWVHVPTVQRQKGSKQMLSVRFRFTVRIEDDPLWLAADYPLDGVENVDDMDIDREVLETKLVRSAGLNIVGKE